MKVIDSLISSVDPNSESVLLRAHLGIKKSSVRNPIAPLESSVPCGTIFFDSEQSGEEYSCSSLANDVISEDIGCPHKSPAFLSSIPNHMKRLCEYKLLSPEMEQHLFTKLNGCKFHISRIIQLAEMIGPS